MAVRIWSPAPHWQEYLSCIVMHLVAPFAPLFLEWFLTEQVEAKSWCLFVAMYALAIGITSSSKLMFGITLLVGIVFSAFFGAVSKGALPASGAQLERMAIWVLAFIVVIHALERYNRHVVDRAPFWEFSKNDDRGPPAPASTPTTQQGAK